MPSQQLPLVNQREPLPPLMHFSLRFFLHVPSLPSFFSWLFPAPSSFFSPSTSTHRFFSPRPPLFFSFKSCIPFSLSIPVTSFLPSSFFRLPLSLSPLVPYLILVSAFVSPIFSFLVRSTAFLMRVVPFVVLSSVFTPSLAHRFFRSPRPSYVAEDRLAD